MTRKLAILLLVTLCLGLGTSTSAAETNVPPDAPGVALPSYYPLQRLPLPQGSILQDFTTILEGEKQSDYLTFTLAMDQQEAAAYFKPLLEQDAEFYTEGEADFVPLEIQGAYPEAASQRELFARYSPESGNLAVARVSLYTLADHATVVVAQLQITFHQKPE